MFKKILCAAIMTALLVSQAVCVLADEVTEPMRNVTTKTTYAGDQVSVETTVLNVAEGDEITYLAYTGGEVTDDTIAYIDQKTVGIGETSVKFEYVADFKFNGSKVMVGGLDKSANAAFAVDATGTINANAVVTIVTDETSKEYSIAPVTDDKGFTLIKGATVDGTTLSDVTWFAAADGIWVANSVLNGKAAVTLTWSGTAPAIEATPALGAVKNIDDKLLVLATKAAGAAEYGIKVSKKAFDGLKVVDALGKYTENEVEKEVTTADLADKIVKYAALGTDAKGNYVVAIEGLLEDNVEYFVAAYSDDSDTSTTTIKNVVENATPEEPTEEAE